MRRHNIYIYNVLGKLHNLLPSLRGWGGAMLLFIFLLFCLNVSAQTDTIRYVKTTGEYTNNGRSWTNAKNDLQDAINDLRQYLQDNNLTSGSIYVAAGTYKPSESTESEGGGLQNTSFKIYPGIHIYGGFAAEPAADAKPFNDDGTVNETYRPLDHSLSSLESGQAAKVQPWNFVNKTILSGSHNADPTFTYDEAKGTYTTVFPGNSYHVVWFATEGFIPTENNDLLMHAKPLSQLASIDGCTITGGNAINKTTTPRNHTSYGGGVYMTAGASLTRCVVDHCAATLRGGGVYMDGGGRVDRCFINTCQSSGVGIMQGYGGGVCIDYEGTITRSYIVNNSARLGGGVAICHETDNYPGASAFDNAYNPFATACIVSNNTATAEGGGVYLNNGGIANHLTITRNSCVGADVTYYGRRHGRSGGIYIVNGGQMYNSVVWGNKCKANDDIQYAAHTSGSTETLKPQIYYSAIDRHDITDWVGTYKFNIYSLESTNTNTSGNDANYPYFIGSNGEGSMNGYAGAGYNPSKGMGSVTYADAPANTTIIPAQTGIPRPIYWKPAAITSLGEKGVQVTDALATTSEDIRHAHVLTDLFGEAYEPASSLGALIRRDEQFGCVLVANQEKQWYADKEYTQAKAEAYSTAVGGNDLTTFLPDGGTEATLPTIFVDPSRNAGAKGIVIGEQNIGTSWDKPVGHINDAIYYFKNHLKRDGSGNIEYDANGVTYLIDTDNDGTPEEYKHVQILVKGGAENGSPSITTTAGLGAYLGSELRTAAIRPSSNMRIYGGYKSTLSETQTSDRNPLKYPTRVTANVARGSYQNNSAHVFALINVKNVIVDGFQLFYGNANLSTALSYAPIDPVTGEREEITFGGGIIVNNLSRPQAERIDMTGNILRNSEIANCSAPDGAAVYVNSGNQKEGGGYCQAELNIINTIIRNNTIGKGNSAIETDADAGIVMARGPLAVIRLDHCDIVNNCGYPLETESLDDSEANEGRIHIYNSVIYANGKIDRDNRSKIVQPLSCHSSTKNMDHIDGSYIYMDWDAPKVNNASNCFLNLCRDFSDHYKKWGIRKMDSFEQTIITNETPEIYVFDTESDANTYINENSSNGGWSWSTPTYLDYPYFANPSRNVGHSEEGDKPMNGGTIDYMPQDMNPMVNAAIFQSTGLWDASNGVRTYGGDPDIGAIEGTDLPLGGTVLYVTPNGAGRRDGSSWGNAIAGNTIYALNGAAAGSDALDTTNGTKRIINNTNDGSAVIGTENDNGVLTTDPRYCGGFGRVWMTDWKTGGSTTTTVTKTWLTEKKIYDDGAREGEEEILHDGTTPTEESDTVTNNAGTISPEFTTAGYYNDPNFPYGEISGASRSFWRANPYHEGTGWNNAANYADRDAFIEACNDNGWIKNNRTENYVGGLQYAVEKAAAYNALPENDAGRITGIDSVQVWVGNGTYNDYKGFVMRDNTTVMGGFPVDAVGTPGLAERQALMSNTVNIPKSKQAKDFDPKDYETILQISDVDPKQDNNHLNTAAVKFWDDDYSLLERSDTKTTEYKNRTVIHHYKWGTAEGTEVTSSYLTYPTFKNVSFTPTPTDEGGYRNYTFGAEVTGKDRWHLKHPIKDNYIVNIENSNNNKNKSRAIYDPKTNVRLKDGEGNNISFVGNWIFLGNGSMTGTEFWQTMPDVHAGKYRLYVDMAGGYRNMFSSTDSTYIYFKIIAADGTTDLIDPVMLKTIDSYTNKPNPVPKDSRDMAYRYALDFEQLTDGDITIKIVVEDGVRNTFANGASSPTDTGVDPEDIPCSYVYDGANCTGNQWGSNNPNRREFWMSNLRLLPITAGYEEDMSQLVDQVGDRQDSETVYETGTLYTSKNHRVTLRKRVLTMPDVCVPTYGGGSVGDPTATNRGKFQDHLSHTHRVKGDTKAKRTSWESNSFVKEDKNYKEYSDVVWDGFTIRHGFLSDEAMGHGGGAGVNMYEGAHLRNCVIINNMSYCERVKGGGIFCDGATSTIEGCFVLNNTSTHGKLNDTTDQWQVFAGGMFMYEGTCFNSLFANNYSYGSAGGVGFCVGRFYNNTIAYNTCDLKENGEETVNGGAISVATASSPNLFLANTIIYGNSGRAIRQRYDQKNNPNNDIPINSINPFINCYVQSEVAFTHDVYLKNINNYSTSGNYGIGNVLRNGVAPSAENTPFAADLDDGGNYTGNAGIQNDFSLTLTNNNCINKGTTDFAGSLKDVLKRKRSWSDALVESQFIYQSVSAVHLPSNDVVYAARIQDCQIDMGAYEYDGSQEIKPGYELISFNPEHPETRELCAVYYVSSEGSGLATGDSPNNRACATKLQKILDAAGRLKADLKLGTRTYSSSNVTVTGTVTATYENITSGETKSVAKVSVTGQDLANVKHVIVKLTGNTIFYPQRTTNHKVLEGVAEEVILERSLMIPRGVEVMGGYDTDFFETTRDPLNHKTILSGQVLNEQTGAYGNAYHVIKFTNTIYNENEEVVKGGADGKDEELLKSIVTDRAVVDGVSLEDGYANGTSDEDKSGAACVVTDFAHVRNCIIQDNQSVTNGGGLYLQPGALVSGCVMLNNEAQLGGAIYVEEPQKADLDNMTPEEREAAYARLFNTTIVRNNADTRGGGLWFETNIRAKGVVLWGNTSNDMNNVAGAFDTEKEQTEANYPFAYCAVQARRLPGVNNIDVKAPSEEGVRWTTNSNDDMRWRGDKPTYSSQTNKDAYYYINKLSALVRSGLPYQLYKDQQSKYPTLEFRDMAGVARMEEYYDGTDVSKLQTVTFEPEEKNNSFLEIGARALDANIGFDINNRPFTRLFVAPTDQVNSSVAGALLECDDPLYCQQGSSMANPFQKLGDALDYVVAQRSRTDFPEGDNSRTWGQIYADTRFEIFVAGGTYYPFHNARGEEGHARSSTYIVPEGVTIVGGMNPDTYYCQAGYDFPINQPMAGNYRLNYYDDYRGNNRSNLLDESNTALTLPITFETSITTDAIMEAREHEDINGNNVYEPWEFKYASTLSGDTPRGEENEGNVYHVITCFADPEHVGTLPRRYKTAGDTPYNKFSNPATSDADAALHETDASILQRSIILNGLNITNGNARDYERQSVNNLQQFYRGGGIMVDGNWKDAEDDSEQADADDKGARDIPLFVANSQFQNNNAIQGGAIFTNGTLYVFGCSFVQNYAQGPIQSPTQTLADKTAALNAIQYNGGGAIATNGTLRCVNSIFANNEAMLGDWNYRMGTTAKGWTGQGFGGAIWGGANSNVRILNCDIVMNQAVSYPGVYINHTNYSNSNRFCANTVFWGNKTTGITDSNFSGITTDINDDVFSYRTQAEKEGTQTDELNSRQPMFFCAYRPGFGPEPKLSASNITISGLDNFHNVNVNGTYDPHQVPFLGEGDVNYYNIFGGNNNINITFANEGADGPNFLLPSDMPGKDGYNASANWMPSRVNNLTDNGWSYLILTSDTQSGDIEFKKVGSSNHNQSGTKPEKAAPDNEVSGGPYNLYSHMLRDIYGLTLMPLGDQYYMKFKNSNMTDGEKDMLRISSNPLTFDEAPAYIDIGVYEYQHRNLRINQSSEIDVLWVTDLENTENGNDGYTWETPTSNLQAAIETLLRSRNDHAKQINIIAGEYKPSVILGDQNDMSLSFTIQTKLYNNAAFTPYTGRDYGIRSLTLRGGYDKEIPGENGYDFDKNKVKLSIDRRVGASDEHLNHIVNILDAEQYTTNVSDQAGTNKSNTPRGRAIPITFDGITFENNLAGAIDGNNPGGAAICYHEQTQTLFDVHNNPYKSNTLLKPPAKSTYTPGNPSDSDDAGYWTWDWTTSSGEPKLTIRNCTFLNNGKEVTDPSSAVKIEGGGGSTLIVNSLFHHNAGNPVDAVNTTVLNCTSALNKGHINLSETTEDYDPDHTGDEVTYHSALHNSVIWKDDQANNATADSPATQYEGVSLGNYMTYNAITGLSPTPDAKNNYGLSDTNEDVLKGPNFTDPDNGDFHLRPSKLVMNAGDDETYANIVWPSYSGNVTIGGNEMTAHKALMKNIHPDQDDWETRRTTIRNGNTETTVEYQIVKANKDYALNYVDRLLGTSIDRGAYECTSHGQRVIYMDPNKTSTGTKTGRNWENAYGHGQLQTAIDAATIYSGEGQAYVFVKGHNTANSEETLTMHNGVSVYGSILPTEMSQAVPKNASAEQLEYTEAELDAFVNRVKAERRGMAAKNAMPTRIKGVRTVEESYGKSALLDGFLISDEGTKTTPATTPIVSIATPKTALKNSIITDNVMADNTPIVSIDNTTSTEGKSLIYNTLVYGNTSGGNAPVINVGANGYVLNCTVIPATGQTGLGGTNGSNTNNQKNNIVAESTGKMFAPYLREGANVYTPSIEFTHEPYWYQLHEESKEINGGTDNGSGANGGNSIAADFPGLVDFSQDRDILGNPRRLGGTVDNGAFETWKVESNKYATNVTNGKADNKYATDMNTSDPGFDDALMEPRADYWSENYGGNLYPHDGSVVYIGENAVLSFDQEETTHTGTLTYPYAGGTPLFTSESPIRPGYLLVKEGGSLYGNGNTIQLSYVAAERKPGEQYELMALPFDYDIANAYTVSHESGTDQLTQNLCNLTVNNGKTYDGDKRSHWNYQFKTTDSDCWTTALTSTQLGKNEGWLMSSTLTNKAIRFTSWGSSETDYVYEEDGTEKTVTLTQYDERPNDGTAHFTSQENMGWNLKGLPWLVSNYSTDTQAADGTYQMNVPHVFYSTLSSNDDTYGQFYTKQSWDSGASLSLGKGFFTQTAVIGDGATETLKFKVPFYTENTVAPVKPMLMMIAAEPGTTRADYVELHPSEDADKEMPYHLGADGVKWFAFNEELPQLYLLNGNGAPISLMSSAPVETDIPVGVKMTEESELTFRLPEREAFEEYGHVWLTDKETGMVTDLMDKDYKMKTGTTGHINNRLLLRIGGLRPDGAEPLTGIQIRSRKNKVYISGLQQGDEICIYLPNGMLVLRDTAHSSDYSHVLRKGVYVVKAQGTVKTLTVYE